MPSLPTLTPNDTALHVLPGVVLVTFLMRMGTLMTALVVSPDHFLDGLRAASHALSFVEVLRDEERPDELLPWAGNV
ncbi:MAG: hypothetical protein JNJ71_09330 [Rubrivivax sp.]|nr:hypothetical protein [Rubrivivax sp.]